MTEEEQFNYCGTIMMAARKCGVYARIEDRQGSYVLVVFDVINRKHFQGIAAPTKKQAVEFGCNAIVNNWSIIG
jgi:hypothetical protein